MAWANSFVVQPVRIMKLGFSGRAVPQTRLARTENLHNLAAAVVGRQFDFQQPMVAGIGDK